MKNLHELDHFRDTSRQVVAFMGSIGNHETGVFSVPHPATGVTLRVIASVGLGWDHVSVSLPNRCPNWPEMSFIARLFFREDEAAVQFHVPASDHVNFHPYCLHWWRPLHGALPRPAKELVGPS